VSEDWRLVERARRLGGEPTAAEKRLWRHLSGSQLAGYKFRRQAALAPFIADFFCPSMGLVVEIDGHTHVAEDDARRDAMLAKRGFTTLRFTNGDVMGNVEGVLSAILQTLENLPDRWNSDARLPHPNPSPEGEGLI
jgi:very-short-patch-repair endonuclease